MRGPETEKSHLSRLLNGFYNKYMSGKGLDIGYRGSISDAEPVLSDAIGVDMDYPGYDGKTLPFPDESQDYVFASHVLEHIDNPMQAVKEWFRVLKPQGHLVICVPHQYLYEKKLARPSQYNEDHKKFYTAWNLMLDIDSALPINHWRLRHMRDNDRAFDYSIPPERHSSGCYEIECVIQKIVPPKWELK